MENEIREQLQVMRGLLGETMELGCSALEMQRDGLMSRGFTRGEAMELLVAQTQSGTPIVKVG